MAHVYQRPSEPLLALIATPARPLAATIPGAPTLLMAHSPLKSLPGEPSLPGTAVQLPEPASFVQPRARGLGLGPPGSTG